MPPIDYINKKYHHFWSQKYLDPGNKIYRTLPYKSVYYETSPNLGTSPVYKLLLHRYGVGYLNAIRNCSLSGEQKSDFTINYFAKICYSLELLDIESLKSSYRREGTCQQGQKISITLEDDSICTIEDFGEYGPINLWTLQQILQNAITNLNWKQNEKDAPEWNAF